MGLLENGSQWLAETFRADHDITVIYSREPHGVGNEIDINVTVGRDQTEYDEGVYSTAKSEQRDFLLEAADLSFSSPSRTNKRLHQPRAGDMILEQLEGSNIRRCYKLIEVPGDGPWRWHDASYQTYRVHTTLVEEDRA